MSFRATYPYELPHLPPKIEEFDPKLVKLLIEARVELAELNGYSHRMPNPMLLLSPTILRESVASSSIENINTTVAEVLQAQLFPEVERPETNKEVLRYNEAVMEGYEELKTLPITVRLIDTIQSTLMVNDYAGLRKVQNSIINSVTGEPIYTPPPASTVPELLSNWVKYINEETNTTDPLLKCAIAHYQFEAIHPYLDGNGRTGRILMVLMLVQAKILELPILFISGYIDKHRSTYYKLLLEVTTNGNWNEYLLFMTKGFKEQAHATKKLLFQVTTLFEETRTLLKKQHPKIYSGDLVEAMFQYPIVTPVKLSEALNIHRTTASRYLAELASEGLLRDQMVGKYHLYINEKLLSLLNS